MVSPSKIEQVLAEQERSIRWLALKVELDPAYVWKMIRGQRPLTDEFKADAARVLGVDVDELFDAEAVS